MSNNEELSTPVPVSEGSQVSGGGVGPASGVVAGSNQAATGAGNGPGGVVPVPVAAQLPIERERPGGSVSVSPWRPSLACTHQAGCPVHGDVRDCEPIECPHLADVLAGRAKGCHDDSTCGWCATHRRRGTAQVPVPVAAQPRYILDKDAILELVQRYGTACYEADHDEEMTLLDAIRAALTPVPDVEPEPRWGSGPLVDHNPETLRTQREMDADLYENWVTNQEAGTGSADPDGGQR